MKSNELVEMKTAKQKEESNAPEDNYLCDLCGLTESLGCDCDEILKRVKRQELCVNACEGLANEALESGVVGEMVEALKALEKGFIDGSIKFTKKRFSDTDPYHPANVKMTRVLTKATGGK